MHGKGLGQRLLKHSCEIARKKGSKTLSLDVSSKNENAINSYKKFGMEISSFWPDFLKLPPVFTRMVKEL
jgi:ribosomal protein S18 acetylase RimI-like enzyme